MRCWKGLPQKTQGWKAEDEVPDGSASNDENARLHLKRRGSLLYGPL